MACHLRRSRPRPECPRSLHQPRLRPRHRGRLLSDPPQTQPEDPRAEEPGGPRMIRVATVPRQKPPRRGDTEIWPSLSIALSEARRPCRSSPTPANRRRKELHRPPVAPYNHPTAGGPRPGSTSTRHARGRALARGPMLLNKLGPILLQIDSSSAPSSIIWSRRAATVRERVTSGWPRFIRSSATWPCRSQRTVR